MTNLPLRLRRRRDGSLCLTDPVGRIDGDGRVFPSEHLFLFGWLNGEGASVARVELTDAGRVIRLRLANAEAVYAVVEDQAEQVVTMVRLADHRGSLRALDTEHSDRVGIALARQGILGTLVDFRLSAPVKLDEAKAAQRAVECDARNRAEALARAKALLAIEGNK